MTDAGKIGCAASFAVFAMALALRQEPWQQSKTLNEGSTSHVKHDFKLVRSPVRHYRCVGLCRHHGLRQHSRSTTEAQLPPNGIKFRQPVYAGKQLVGEIVVWHSGWIDTHNFTNDSLWFQFRVYGNQGEERDRSAYVSPRSRARMGQTPKSGVRAVKVWHVGRKKR